MSKQPQEWTPEYVRQLCKLQLSDYDAQAIADAHNAALAALDERGENLHAKYRETEAALTAEQLKRDEVLLAIVTAKRDNVKLKQQLAAEQEKSEELQRQLRIHSKWVTVSDSAELQAAYAQKCEQLATAERMLEGLRNALDAEAKAHTKTGQQLAAERELRERAETNMRNFIEKEHNPIVEELKDELHTANELIIAHNEEFAAEQEKVSILQSSLKIETDKAAKLAEETKRLRHRLRVYEYDHVEGKIPRLMESDPLSGHSKTPHGLPNPP